LGGVVVVRSGMGASGTRSGLCGLPVPGSSCMPLQLAAAGDLACGTEPAIPVPRRYDAGMVIEMANRRGDVTALADRPATARLGARSAGSDGSAESGVAVVAGMCPCAWATIFRTSSGDVGRVQGLTGRLR
jgi:hypothetical protein